MGLERSSGKSWVQFALRSFILFLENLALELGTNTEQTARVIFSGQIFPWLPCKDLTPVCQKLSKIATPDSAVHIFKL